MMTSETGWALDVEGDGRAEEFERLVIAKTAALGVEAQHHARDVALGAAVQAHGVTEDGLGDREGK